MHLLERALGNLADMLTQDRKIGTQDPGLPQFGRKLGDWGEEPKPASTAGFGDTPRHGGGGGGAADGEDDSGLAAAIAASLEDTSAELQLPPAAARGSLLHRLICIVSPANSLNFKI